MPEFYRLGVVCVSARRLVPWEGGCPVFFGNCAAAFIVELDDIPGGYQVAVHAWLHQHIGAKGILRLEGESRQVAVAGNVEMALRDHGVDVRTGGSSAMPEALLIMAPEPSTAASRLH